MMAAWCADGFPAAPRRDVVLHAIREHDNGWREEDVAPLLDVTTGRPLDFVNVPDAIRWRLWPRGIEALGARPYEAALVAQHAITIHEAHRANPAWARF